MTNARGKEPYIQYLWLRGHKQDRNLEMRLAARMIPHCRKRGRLVCDHCPDLEACRGFWDNFIVNVKGYRGILDNLYAKWKEKVLHDTLEARTARRS